MNFDKVIGCKCKGGFMPCTSCGYTYGDSDCRGIVEDLDGEYVYEGEDVNKREKYEYFVKAGEDAKHEIEECGILLAEAVLEDGPEQIEDMLKAIDLYERAADKLHELRNKAYSEIDD